MPGSCTLRLRDNAIESTSEPLSIGVICDWVQVPVVALSCNETPIASHHGQSIGRRKADAQRFLCSLHIAFSDIKRHRILSLKAWSERPLLAECSPMHGRSKKRGQSGHQVAASSQMEDASSDGNVLFSYLRRQHEWEGENLRARSRSIVEVRNRVNPCVDYLAIGLQQPDGVSRSNFGDTRPRRHAWCNYTPDVRDLEYLFNDEEQRWFHGLNVRFWPNYGLGHESVTRASSPSRNS
jgi:hypothetical protein